MPTGLAAPFLDEVAQLITQTHEQRVTLRADVAGPLTLTLDVIDYDIDWDETRTPRVQGSFDVAVPDTQATLDLLDPRTAVKVHLLVGYRLASGEWDEHEVALLYLRQRRLNRTEDNVTLSLDVTSAESMFIEASGSNPGAGDSTFAQPSLTDAVRSYVTDLFAGTPFSGITTVGAKFGGAVAVPMEPNPWDALSDIAEQLDANIYDNGTGEFIVAPRVVTVSDAVLSLSVGANGTLLSTSSGVSRDDWANWVTVWYVWTDTAGVRHTDGGFANVVSGPFTVANAGYKTLLVEKPFFGDASSGNRLARTTLRRMLARSRSYTVTAVPAWWVRPEDTVTLQLPLGSQERHLVSRVGFRPGVMTIETRLPDTASEIGE